MMQQQLGPTAEGQMERCSHQEMLAWTEDQSPIFANMCLTLELTFRLRQNSGEGK